MPFANDIFAICSDAEFEAAALETFRFQAAHCAPYAEYLHLLGVDPATIRTVADIPFLPVEVFKVREVYGSPGALPNEAELVFTSSGTTGHDTSTHYVASAALYRESFLSGFGRFWGQPEEWLFFALLPSYLERAGSSLVCMAKGLMEASGSLYGGFFLDDFAALLDGLQKAAADGSRRIMLLGVSFALLDFSEWLAAQGLSLHLPDSAVVMETGGMKGRRRETSREELHSVLCRTFGVGTVASEYGMTELLSQAYSRSGGIFECPPWMRIAGRDLQNPLRPAAPGVRAAVNVIDLANRFSCSFIATQDSAIVNADGSYRLLGRLAGAQLRGCTMLAE